MKDYITAIIAICFISLLLYANAYYNKMTPTIFKDSAAIVKQLQDDIDKYLLAKKKDDETLHEIEATLIQLFSQHLKCKVVLEEGASHDENFTLTLLKGNQKIKLTIIDFMISYSFEVKENTDLEFISELRSNLNAALPLISDKATKLTEECQLISGDFFSDYNEAEERLLLVQKRKRATRKWFLQQGLLFEQDIQAFLQTLNEGALIQIMDEFQIGSKYRVSPIAVIMESLTI